MENYDLNIQKWITPGYVDYVIKTGVTDITPEEAREYKKEYENKFDCKSVIQEGIF